MVRPCGILRRDAIETRGDYLIARGSCRRRFVHSARAGCLLAAGLIKSRSARFVYVPVAVGNDHLRFDLRLSSHCATPATAGFSHRGPCHAVNHFTFNRGLNTDCAQRSRRPRAAHWTTNRFLIADCRFSIADFGFNQIGNWQSAISNDLTQSLFALVATHRSRNGCGRPYRRLTLRRLA